MFVRPFLDLNLKHFDDVFEDKRNRNSVLRYKSGSKAFFGGRDSFPVRDEV